MLHVANVPLNRMLRILVDQLVADRLDHALVRLLQRLQLLVERIETAGVMWFGYGLCGRSGSSLPCSSLTNARLMLDPTLRTSYLNTLRSGGNAG